MFISVDVFLCSGKTGSGIEGGIEFIKGEGGCKEFIEGEGEEFIEGGEGEGEFIKEVGREEGREGGEFIEGGGEGELSCIGVLVLLIEREFVVLLLLIDGVIFDNNSFSDNLFRCVLLYPKRDITLIIFSFVASQAY